MAITSNKKKELVTNLDKFLKGSNSVVFVKFDKLTVADSNKFRRNLQNENINYFVTKKTLLKRALDSQKVAGEMPELDGQIAIAYGEDKLAVAREVYNFQKTHKDNLGIIGGVFEDRYMSKEEMMSIATIPSIEILYGKFVNVINSPLQCFAVVLEQIRLQKEQA